MTNNNQFIDKKKSFWWKKTLWSCSDLQVIINSLQSIIIYNLKSIHFILKRLNNDDIIFMNWITRFHLGLEISQHWTHNWILFSSALKTYSLQYDLFKCRFWRSFGISNMLCFTVLNGLLKAKEIKITIKYILLFLTQKK